MTTDPVSQGKQFTLAPDQLAELFPFHLVLDKEMKIVQIGEVIRRILEPIPLLDSYLEEHFLIHRPNCLFSFEAIRQHRRSLFLLQSRHKEMQLKGQMVYLEASDHLLFMGSPWVTDIADMKKLDLSLNDFPIWDSVSDYLFLLQTKNAVLEDARKLTEKLKDQRIELLVTASRLRTLIESLQTGILLEDDTRHVILANQEFCNHFKIPLTPKALQGMDCQQFVEVSKQLFVEPEQFIRHLDEILSQNTMVLHKEWQLQDGRILEQSYIPIVVDDKLYGHLWKYYDITLHKQAENRSEDRQECLKVGMDDYISKPISPETIVAVLKKLDIQQNKASESPTWTSLASALPSLSPEPNREEVINEHILQDLRNMAGSDGDRLVAELIQIYLEDTPVRIQMIKDASEIEDRSKLQKAAHALRSPSVSLGAVYLGKICETLEDAANNQSWHKLSELVNQLESEYHNVITAFQSLHSHE